MSTLIYRVSGIGKLSSQVLGEDLARGTDECSHGPDLRKLSIYASLAAQARHYWRIKGKPWPGLCRRLDSQPQHFSFREIYILLPKSNFCVMSGTRSIIVGSQITGSARRKATVTVETSCCFVSINSNWHCSWSTFNYGTGVHITCLSRRLAYQRLERSRHVPIKGRTYNHQTR